MVLYIYITFFIVNITDFSSQSNVCWKPTITGTDENTIT
jgi:hypothetical protein